MSASDQANWQKSFGLAGTSLLPSRVLPVNCRTQRNELTATRITPQQLPKAALRKRLENRMHIAYLLTPSGIPLGGNSGSSHHVASLVDAFYRQGHEVSLFPARQLEGPDPLPNARIIELPPQQAPWWRRSRSLRERWQAQRFAHRALPHLRDPKPAFLYERYALFSDAGALLRQKLSRPWVLEVNAPLRLERTRFEGLRGQNAARRAEFRILGAADLLVVVSHPLARWLETLGIPTDRILVVPNGVDGRVFYPRESRNGVRERLGLLEGPVVGFVGSLKPWHGLNAWLEAFERLHQRLPSVQGLIVGDGPGRAQLESQVASMGLSHSVRFTGRLPQVEVADVMGLLSLVLAPYPRLDPFYFCPLKVLEAQAMGIPVISNHQGDLPMLIGRGGAIVPPEDVQALVEAMTAALSDECLLRTWSAAALTQSEGRDWLDVASTIVSVVEKLPGF